MAGGGRRYLGSWRSRNQEQLPRPPSRTYQGKSVVGVVRGAPVEDTGVVGGGRQALGGGHTSKEIKGRQLPGSELMNGQSVQSLIEN